MAAIREPFRYFESQVFRRFSSPSAAINMAAVDQFTLFSDQRSNVRSRWNPSFATLNVRGRNYVRVASHKFRLTQVKTS
jgi:hypothetical protein